MKNIFVFAFILASFCAIAQSGSIVKTAAINYSAGAPAWVPNANTASELAFDSTGKRFYVWNRKSRTWDLQGRFIDEVAGASAPAYMPSQTDSWIAVNNANPPEIYAWSGSAWVKAGGVTYTAGTGITITGTTIANAGDLSNTNELQTIDTFLVSGSNLLLSLTQDNQPAKTITLPASGITALTGDVTATGPGSAVASIANGAVTGAKLAANSVDSTKVAPLSIANSDIANVAPEKLLQKGASTGQVLGWNGSIWGPTAAGISGSGANGQVAYWTGANTQAGSNNLFWDATNSRLGVGTTSTVPTFGGSNITMARPLTGGATIHGAALFATINSDVGFGLGFATSLSTQAATFSTRIRHYSASQGTFGAGSTVTEQSGFEVSSTLTGATTNYAFVGGIPSGTNRWNLFMSGTANNSLAGSTIIGAISAPAARLHVVGSGITSATWGLQVHNSTGTNNALMVRDDGNVGVGTSTPSGKLHVFSLAGRFAVFNSTGILDIQANDLSANDAIRLTNTENTTNTGSNITYRLGYGGSASVAGTPITAGRISVLAEQAFTATASTQDSYMAFSTSIDGAIAERMRITSGGNVGIGTNAPTDRLDITGANGYSQLRLRTAYTPTSTADTNGNPGDISWDENYFYVKTAAGWKRSALTTF